MIEITPRRINLCPVAVATIKEIVAINLKFTGRVPANVVADLREYVKDDTHDHNWRSQFKTIFPDVI